RQTVRIAQSAGKNPKAAAGAIDLEDGGAVMLGLHPVLGDVAVRADADIELRAVGTRNQALGPVMIDRPAWQWSQRRTRCGDFGVAFVVGISDDGVGVGDVEIVADQRDAEWRIEMIEEYAPGVRHAVAVSITQQRDAVARPRVAARRGPGLD